MNETDFDRLCFGEYSIDSFVECPELWAWCGLCLTCFGMTGSYKPIFWIVCYWLALGAQCLAYIWFGWG